MVVRGEGGDTDLIEVLQGDVIEVLKGIEDEKGGFGIGEGL